jgi:putative Mg2+ transporter-C (MgtC) family protein
MPLFEPNEYMWRILIAALLGGVVGIEREMTHKSAGLRTHMLVCMGACIFMVLSMSNLTEAMLANIPTSDRLPVNINYDPSRIAAQIVTGIGFIGGGALLKEGTSVRGITTAASLWNMAGIGMLTGAGMYQLAIFATVIGFLILYIMGKIQYSRLHKKFKDKDVLTLILHVKESKEGVINDFIEHHLEERIRSMETARLEGKPDDDEHDPLLSLTYVLNIRGFTTNWNKWKQRLKRIKGVKRIVMRFDEDRH